MTPVMCGEVAPRALKATTIRKQNRDEAFLESVVAYSPELLGFEPYESHVAGPWVPFRQVTLTTADGRSIAADLIFLTGSGHVVVVEVKLEDNPELRGREVIAQAIDYAAALAALDPADLLPIFGRNHTSAQSWPELVGALFPNASDASNLAAAFVGRLRDGEIHVVIACDGVPDGLAEMVRAVTNQRTRGGYSLRVVELRPFVLADGGELLLMPSVRVRTEIIARTSVVVSLVGNVPGENPTVTVTTTPLDETVAAEKETQTGRAKYYWDESSVLAAIEANGDSSFRGAATRLHAFAKRYRGVTYGNGKVGSFSARFSAISSGSVFNLYVDGRMDIALPNISPAILDQLQARVWGPANIVLTPGQKFPRIPAEQWAPHVDRLIETLQEFAGPAPDLAKS